MEQRRPGWRAAGSVLAVGLLGATALELHAVEARLIAQTQQLRTLGEATERVAAQLDRLHGVGLTAPRMEASLEGVRHPEVKDFLSPKQTHWPPTGAKTTQGIAIDYPFGDPKGFNPIIENDGNAKDKLTNLVEATIARRNSWTDPDSYYGDLAQRVEVRDDFKEFTIYLRHGVKWHPVSGVDLNDPRYAWLNTEHFMTAQDFVFMFDMLLNPQVQNGFMKSYYQELASWKALDDYTLELRWNKTQELNVVFSLEISPLPKFLYAYAEDGTPIPENAIGLNLNQHWYNNKGIVGTGPYRFARYTPGVQIVLERNEEFYGERPALANIRYAVYSDRTQTVLKLKSGELDFGLLRPGQYREQVLQYEGLPEAQRPKNNPFLNGEIKCDVVEDPRYYYIGWNEENPLFKDRRVRRAMTLALNRQEIVKKVFAGLGEVARGPFLASTFNLAPEIQPLPFDLKQAAALLHEAGWSDTDGDGLLDQALEAPNSGAAPGSAAARAAGKRKPFEFTLLVYGSSPEFSSVANIFKEDLLSIGVKMNIDAAEWSLMQKRMEEKKFDAFTGAWGLPWSQDPYQVWHSSQADIPKGSNRVGFRNKDADKLIEQLRVTLDREERIRLFRDLHRIIDAEQPYSFMFVPRFAHCHRPGIENLIYAKTRPIADSQPWWSSRSDG